MTSHPLFAVPAPLFVTLAGELPWLEAVPDLAADYLERWKLRLDGKPLHGAASVILPVVRTDGTPAMLKLQPVNEENADEALGLRTWGEEYAVRVLEDAPDATILLERLEPRSLSDLPDDTEATRDPCFELYQALNNRWDDLVATGDLPRAIPRRFDLMVEVVGLDRERAVGWTLGRILQNVLWELEGGQHAVDPVQVAIAAALEDLRL